MPENHVHGLKIGGWEWTNTTIDSKVPYFDVLSENIPFTDFDAMPSVPGSLIMYLEGSYKYLSSSIYSGFSSHQRRPLPTTTDIDNGYRFSVRYIDHSGNIGPKQYQISEPVSLQYPGSLRGNIFIRPYDHNNIYSFDRLAKGVVVSMQWGSGSNWYPIFELDFEKGFRYIIDNSQVIQMNMFLSEDYPHLIDDFFGYMWEPLRAVDAEYNRGLYSLTGSFGIGYGGFKKTMHLPEDFMEEDLTPSFTYIQNGVSVQKTFTPEEWVHIQYAKGTTLRTGGYFPFEILTKPTVTEEMYFNITNEEDYSVPYRFKTATVNNLRAYIGHPSKLLTYDSLGSDELGTVPISSGGMIDPKPDTIKVSPLGIEDESGKALGRYDHFESGDELIYAKDDGDPIIHMESKDSRIFVFKRNSMYIINTSQEVDIVEDKVQIGIRYPSQVVSTPKGVAFFADNAIYIHNGEQLVNLTSRSIDFHELYEGFFHDEYPNVVFTDQLNVWVHLFLTPSLGYDEIGKKLILFYNVQDLWQENPYVDYTSPDGAFSVIDTPPIHQWMQGSVWAMANALHNFWETPEEYFDWMTDYNIPWEFSLYDMLSWDMNNTGNYGDTGIGGAIFTIAIQHYLVFDFHTESIFLGKADSLQNVYDISGKTNFVNIDKNLVYYDYNKGMLYKWNDKPSDHNHFRYTTPYIDFGLKNTKKVIKKIYITWKMDTYNNININDGEEDGAGPNVRVHFFIDGVNMRQIDVSSSRTDPIVVSGGCISTELSGNQIVLRATNNNVKDNKITTITELKVPSNKKKLYNLAISFTNGNLTATEPVDASFEIQDISIIYSETAVK